MMPLLPAMQGRGEALLGELLSGFSEGEAGFVQRRGAGDEDGNFLL